MEGGKVTKVVIKLPNGQMFKCLPGTCWNWVFIKRDDDYQCTACKRPRTAPEGAIEGAFPRPGWELWDRYNQTPNYAFFLGPRGNVQKTLFSGGNWKDGQEISQLIDEAQEEINELKARLARLGLKSVN